MATPGKNKLFTGKHTGRLDAKNRLTIPAAWRFEADGDEEYLATFYPAFGTILVLPPEKVRSIREASENATLGEPDVLEAMRTLGVNSASVSCDKAGRIILSESMLHEARITRDVFFEGGIRNFQISAPEPPPPDVSSPKAQRLLNALKALKL
ncbi:MAG: hypothetical protein LBV54_07060 [Puniceicoccales bacterium]|jgi:MraZ protein|nr:hypothetical protein [Puniceicoccales bacterium]